MGGIAQLYQGNKYKPAKTTFGTPSALFVADKVSGAAPLLVSFTDQSSNVIFSWSWTFGDGSTSAEQNPQHVYAAAGTYTVALTVHGPNGSNTQTRSNYITVS